MVFFKLPISKYILSFLFIFLITSCGKSIKMNVSDHKVFCSENEIDGINQFLVVFDQTLFVMFDEISIEQAYKKFTENIHENLQKDGSYPIYDFADAKSFIFSHEVASEIWWTDPNDSLNFNLSESGKYLKYLENVSNDCSCLEAYYLALSNSFDFASPSMQLGFAEECLALDYKNENFRLILAIHYLSMISYSLSD